MDARAQAELTQHRQVPPNEPPEITALWTRAAYHARQAERYEFRSDEGDDHWMAKHRRFMYLCLDRLRARGQIVGFRTERAMLGEYGRRKLGDDRDGLWA